MRGGITRRTIADVMRDNSAERMMHHPYSGWTAFLQQCATEHLKLEAYRTVLVLPTAEYAPALLSLAAVERLMDIRATQPLDIVDPDEVGHLASVFSGGCYQDTVIRAASEGRIVVGQTSLERYLDIVRVVPDGFLVDRSTRKLDRETISVWSRHVPKDVDGARVHARVSATPVVVIGNRTPLLKNLGDLEILYANALRFCDVGAGIGTWFRHPVICIDPGSDVPHWALSLRPSIVVAVGAAAWRSMVRQAFSTAPQILVLDRRSESSVDVVSDILLKDPRTVPTPVLPPAGVEAWSFEEVLPTGLQSGSEDNEWDLF